MIDYWRRLPKELTTFEPIWLYSLFDEPFPAEGGCGHRLSGAVVNEFFEFQFADDAALVHDSEERLRLMVDLFMEMAQAWGMKVSLDKTKIMAINPSTLLTHFVSLSITIIEQFNVRFCIWVFIFRQSKTNPVIEIQD